MKAVGHVPDLDHGHAPSMAHVGRMVKVMYSFGASVTPRPPFRSTFVTDPGNRAMVAARCAVWRCSAWSTPFSNGPCVLAIPVREVLEVR
jgi:hypothetical protein